MLHDGGQGDFKGIAGLPVNGAAWQIGVDGVTPPFVKNCTLRGKVRKRLALKWTQLAMVKNIAAFLQRADGAFKIHGVPKRDRGDNQI